MLCPICGGNNLTSKREDAPATDFSARKPLTYSNKPASELEARYFQQKKMDEEKHATRTGPSPERHCPLCGYPLQDSWKFCPECGVSLLKK